MALYPFIISVDGRLQLFYPGIEIIALTEENPIQMTKLRWCFIASDITHYKWNKSFTVFDRDLNFACADLRVRGVGAN